MEGLCFNEIIGGARLYGLGIDYTMPNTENMEKHLPGILF